MMEGFRCRMGMSKAKSEHKNISLILHILYHQTPQKIVFFLEVEVYDHHLQNQMDLLDSLNAGHLGILATDCQGYSYSCL